MMAFDQSKMWWAPSRALGEDSYTTMDPDAFERVDDSALPKVYLDYLASLSPAMAQ